MFIRWMSGPPDAIPVLLLHGWTASADLNWVLAYDVLGQRYRVVAPDHRGHGRGIRAEKPFTLEDCADDAAGLLRTLGIRRAIVVGYSMGGPISLLLSLRHPDLVAGLVCQASALEWRASRWERFVWRLLAVAEVGLRTGTRQGLVKRVVRDAIEASPELAPWRAWLAGELRRGDRTDIAAAGRALSLFDARPFAGQIDVPSAVVVTTRDRLVRAKKQRRLAAALRARVFEIDGDHDTPLVKGDVFAVVTRKAVDTVAASCAGLVP